MALIPLPHDEAYPGPGTIQITGFSDVTCALVVTIRRDAIQAFLPRDSSRFTGTFDDSGNPIFELTYAIHAVTAVPHAEVLVAHFDTQAERRAWLRDQAAAWFAPLPAGA